MFLGCIGDDFTGFSDLANTLAKGGMQVTLFSGVPDGASDAEAGVVALKSRTIAPQEAVAHSLAALDWLLAQARSCRVHALPPPVRRWRPIPRTIPRLK